MQKKSENNTAIFCYPFFKEGPFFLALTRKKGVLLAASGGFLRLLAAPAGPWQLPGPVGLGIRFPLQVPKGYPGRRQPGPNRDLRPTT